MPKLSGRPVPASAAGPPLDGRRLAFWYGVFAVSAGILYASRFGYFVYPLTVLAFAELAGDETMPDSQPSAERDSVAAVPGGT